MGNKVGLKRGNSRKIDNPVGKTIYFILFKFMKVFVIKTFKQWCEENNRNKLLELWDENNLISPDEISYGSKKEILFKCGKKLHESRSISLDRVINTKKCLCKKCNSLAQWGIDHYGDNFLKEYWDYNLNNNIDPWELSYSSTKKVYIKCNKNILHKSYLISCNTFTTCFPSSGCPYCNVRGESGRPIKEESLGMLYPQSIEFWSDKNNMTVFDVTPHSHKVVWWKCADGKHEDYKRVISEEIRYDFRCPSCVSENTCSSLETKISQFIEHELGYNIKHELDCSIAPINPNGYNNIRMPYDNEVPELKLIIEVHGKQHYYQCSWHTATAKRNNTSPQEELEKQQYRDLYKKDYAINNGYYYLAIPYYEEENDLYKTTILNKIDEIYRTCNE